jgi:hypothetical protein
LHGRTTEDVTTQLAPNSPLGTSRTHVPWTWQRLGHAAVVAGPIVVFAIAWATSSVSRDVSIANVALVLAAATIAAALLSSLAGLATSVVAAMSLNYFHTAPVHSLRVSSGSDLLAIALLAAIGLMVSTVTALRVRRTAVSRRGVHADGAAADLRESLLSGRPVMDAWDLTVAAAAAQFGLVDVRLQRAGTIGLPTISRKMWGPNDPDVDHLMLLPESGAVVQFRDPRHGEQLVLTPRAGMGAVHIDRRVALTLADQIELSLARLAPSHAAAR